MQWNETSPGIQLQNCTGDSILDLQQIPPSDWHAAALSSTDVKQTTRNDQGNLTFHKIGQRSDLFKKIGEALGKALNVENCHIKSMLEGLSDDEKGHCTSLSKLACTGCQGYQRYYLHNLLHDIVQAQGQVESTMDEVRAVKRTARFLQHWKVRHSSMCRGEVSVCKGLYQTPIGSAPCEGVHIKGRSIISGRRKGSSTKDLADGAENGLSREQQELVEDGFEVWDFIEIDEILKLIQSYKS